MKSSDIFQEFATCPHFEIIAPRCLAHRLLSPHVIGEVQLGVPDRSKATACQVASEYPCGTEGCWCLGWRDVL